MRVYVEAYGCAQNLGEGRTIERDLVAVGHTLVATPDTADVGILVTCGVIGSTEQRMVRRWGQLAAEVPSVVVTGCLVPLRTGLLAGPGRARTTLVPIREQHRIAELISGQTAPLSSAPSPFPSDPPAAPPRREAAEEVVIAQGCTSACSYCYSRLARGHLTSVPMLEVVRRVVDARDRGAVEIRLTSLDTSCWGQDHPAGGRLPQLLESLADLPGVFRIRVGMMSPQSLGPIASEYFALLARDRFFHFLHLPIQTGSDPLLRAMHRGYSVEEFERIVRLGRSMVPGLSLSTDVIIGFPGETEEDHRRTLELLRRVTPEVVNVTRYSPRPGTPAARLTPVPAALVKRRSREISSVRRALSRGQLERRMGDVVETLVIERGLRGSSVARTPNYLPVVLAETLPLGSLARARLVGATASSLRGQLVGAYPLPPSGKTDEPGV